MELKNILEYQKIDSQLYKLEMQLNRSENKKKCITLSNEAKNAQAKSASLEEKAGAVLKEFEEAKRVLSQNTKLADALSKKDVENMTEEEIEQNSEYQEKISQNLQILDKKITKIAETINVILAEYNKTVKAYNDAKEKYKQAKSAYDKEFAEIDVEMQKIKKELSVLEKNVAPEVMEKYMAKRKDKIFPVFMPLEGNACGHCRMEMSASAISKLNTDGVLTCEHCRCILYKK